MKRLTVVKEEEMCPDESPLILSASKCVQDILYGKINKRDQEYMSNVLKQRKNAYYFPVILQRELGVHEKMDDYPKRGRTAYNFFTQSCKKDGVVKDSKSISNLWKNISNDEKSEYEKQASLDKLRYEKEKSEYEIENNVEIKRNPIRSDVTRMMALNRSLSFVIQNFKKFILTVKKDECLRMLVNLNSATKFYLEEFYSTLVFKFPSGFETLTEMEDNIDMWLNMLTVLPDNSSTNCYIRITCAITEAQYLLERFRFNLNDNTIKKRKI